MTTMKTQVAANIYLATPNKILAALGGADQLRKELEATRFGYLHCWPNELSRPYGAFFYFRAGRYQCHVQITASLSKQERYSLIIHNRQNEMVVDRNKLELTEVSRIFFEFVEEMSLLRDCLHQRSRPIHLENV